MATNVLIVEDSQVDRARLEKILAGAGFRVASANDGQAGLDAVARSRPDIILMDVNMPVMDGFAATRALKNDPDTKDIPVVLVTSKDQKADKAWGQMLGAKGYITKPYADDEVLSLLRSL